MPLLEAELEDNSTEPVPSKLSPNPIDSKRLLEEPDLSRLLCCCCAIALCKSTADGGDVCAASLPIR